MNDTEKIYDDFTQIVDCYLSNFDSYQKNKKYSYACVYGYVDFFKYYDEKKIIVHGIYINEQYRKNGLCKNLLFYIIDKLYKTDKIFIVQSVLSKILYEYLERFNYKNNVFIWKKEGFVLKKTI
jgi:dihydrofolate reductase